MPFDLIAPPNTLQNGVTKSTTVALWPNKAATTLIVQVKKIVGSSLARLAGRKG